MRGKTLYSSYRKEPMCHLCIITKGSSPVLQNCSIISLQPTFSNPTPVSPTKLHNGLITFQLKIMHGPGATLKSGPQKYSRPISSKLMMSNTIISSKCLFKHSCFFEKKLQLWDICTYFLLHGLDFHSSKNVSQALQCSPWKTILIISLAN